MSNNFNEGHVFSADKSRPISLTALAFKPFFHHHERNYGPFLGSLSILATEAGIKAITERTLPPLAVVSTSASFIKLLEYFWPFASHQSPPRCFTPSKMLSAKISSGQYFVGKDVSRLPEKSASSAEMISMLVTCC
jgi:hypothetical protein